MLFGEHAFRGTCFSWNMPTYKASGTDGLSQEHAHLQREGLHTTPRAPGSRMQCPHRVGLRGCAEPLHVEPGARPAAEPLHVEPGARPAAEPLHVERGAWCTSSSRAAPRGAWCTSSSRAAPRAQSTKKPSPAFYRRRECFAYCARAVFGAPMMGKG